jgi:hypothetical protein
MVHNVNGYVPYDRSTSSHFLFIFFVFYILVAFFFFALSHSCCHEMCSRRTPVAQVCIDNIFTND